VPIIARLGALMMRCRVRVLLLMLLLCDEQPQFLAPLGEQGGGNAVCQAKGDAVDDARGVEVRMVSARVPAAWRLER
jgi:hypothetical protein